jgi:hypothetical protein
VKVTDLTLGQALVIRKENETISWMKIPDRNSCFVYRRYHWIDGKLVRESDNRVIGEADNEELEVRLSDGFAILG